MSRFLFIDTRVRDNAVFGWLDDESAHKIWKVPTGASGLISSLSARISPKDAQSAKGVCVVSGPGSFSSIRTGTLVANLMSRIFDLPLYELKAEDIDVDTIDVKKITSRRSKKYVAPIYDRPPNVTAPKIKA